MSGDPSDPLDNEVKLTARLDESGASAAVKSRTISALDRLCGNFLYNLGAKGERKAIMAQAQNSAYTQVAKVAADKLAAEIGSSSPDALRIAHKVLENGVRQQESLDKIALSSVDYLVLPAPENKDDNGSDHLQNDWLNMFSRFAGDASSDRMRDLWSRVLAGEIRRPNSFSLTTLRIMSEMDIDIATKFQSAVRLRRSFGVVRKAQNPSLQEQLDLIFLEEVGLLQGVRGLDSESADPENGVYLFDNGGLVLAVESENPPSVPVFFITRAGREIATLLPSEPDDLALRDIAEYIRPSVRTMRLSQVQRDGTEFHEGELIERL